MLSFDPASTLQAVSPFHRRADRLKEGGGLPRSHIWQVPEPDFELGFLDMPCYQQGGVYTPNEASRYIRAFYKCSISLHVSIACLALIGGGRLALVLEPRQSGASLESATLPGARAWTR